MNDTSYVEKTIKPNKTKAEKGTIEATKEYQNYVKSHDPEQAEDFLSKDSDDLKKIISYCTVEIKEATDQVQETPEYQKAKEEVKVFTEGLRDTVKPLKHTIELATLLLRERGANVLTNNIENSIQKLKELGASISVKN